MHACLTPPSTVLLTAARWGVVLLATGLWLHGLGLSLGRATAAEPTRADGRDLVLSALDDAADTGRRVVVLFTATWCPDCQDLKREVLDTPDGRAVLDGVHYVTVDFDTPANRPAVERHAVMALPTVAVFTPSGTQVGRLLGHPGAEQSLAALRAAVTAEDPLPGLERAFASAPTSRRAAVDLGRELLTRGALERGLELLERATWPLGSGADSAESEAAAQALFLLGRYHQRVRGAPDRAQHVWRELAARFSGSPWAAGAWWWYAKAQAALGDAHRGAAWLAARGRAEGASHAAVVEWATFLRKHQLTEGRDDAARRLRTSLDEGDLEAEAREDARRLVEDLTSPSAPPP